MAPADILELNLADLSRLIAARELSSSVAVRAALTRLELLNDKLNAFITVLPEQALADAKKADEEIARGHYRSPLHGVPVSIKDMFEMAGVRTTGGSKILAEWVPETDAALVERLRAAGAIILGKTNLDEFGHGGTSTLSHFGPVHNPWRLERIAGGSIGGSAAAVASCIGPLSYGTETGSSVRRPASYCGIVGFKPTFGIISRHGSFRGAWSQDHVGLFARSVKDIALGLDAVAGFDLRDPASVRQENPAYASRLEAKVRGLRVGVLRRFLEGVDPAVRHAFDDALKVFAGLGSDGVDLDVPEISYAAMTSMMTSAAESAGINRRWFREHYHDFVPHVSRGLAVGMTITASEYLTVQRARHRIRQALQAAFKTVDIIASPTTSRVAPLLSEGLKGNGDDTRHASYNQSNLLRYPSMLGLPGCSLPCGINPEGLPIGLQLVGGWFADQTVLNAAFAYQSSTDWHTRRPAQAKT
ncbi:MAG: Asp-tRNA(Asn)/Glu-tRNA(Gln) amidotransferase subunit GatA [Deltaproteobacteria bacterium]|nr:MAG: Asp-tRNA(Asn)/Glu-tRNA(Gln) amidotransferase subunit GatA [Deltaproteobacteria bacterium]